MIALVRWGILLTCLCAATSVPASDVPDAVTAGRNALRHWTKYPWYDAGHDALQPVKVEVPPEPPERLENSGSLGELLRVLVWTLLALALAALAYLLLRAFAARQARSQPGRRSRRRRRRPHRVAALSRGRRPPGLAGRGAAAL